MSQQRPSRSALRTMVMASVGIAGLALLAGCGSGSGEITVPSGVSLAPGDVTLPDDVTVTRPADEVEPEPEPTAEPEPEPEPAPEPEATPEPEPEPEATGGGVTDETVAPDTTGDEVVWWPWVLGIVVVVAILAAVLARGRRSSSGWTPSALSTLDELDRLTTHLLAIPPEGLALVVRDDARRLAELGASTAELSATAPDDRTRRSIDEVRGPLGQLHAAVDLVALSPTPTDSQLTLVHQWATALHTATSTARASLTTRSS